MGGYRVSYDDGKIIGWQGFYDGAMQAALLPAVQTATIPVGTSATMPFLLSAFSVVPLLLALGIESCKDVLRRWSCIRRYEGALQCGVPSRVGVDEPSH